MTRPRRWSLAVGGVLILALGFAVLKATGRVGVLSADHSLVPTARVTRGSLELTVHAKGDLRASRSKTLSAPAVGGMLRLLRIAETGTEIHAGDVIMEFDPMEQQYALEQARSELLEAEQEATKVRADTDAQAAQDQVTLLTARFDLRRAELDAIPDRDLIGANDYSKRQLTLEEAKRKLVQVEESVKTGAETSRASIAVAEAKRMKAKLTADRAQQNIDSLVVKAPMDGFVVGRENRDANGGFSFSGMNLPEYRAGDNVQPGRPVVDVVDIAHMQVRARVNELERNNVAPGQSAVVQSDALPGVPLVAKVTSVSGMQSDDFFGSNGPLRDFDVMLELDQAGAHLRPGTSVQLVLAGTRVENVLHLPRQAIFERNGKPVVFLRIGDRFEVRDVKPVHRTEDRVAIEGLDEGAEVALVAPDVLAKTSTKSTPPAASGSRP